MFELSTGKDFLHYPNTVVKNVDNASGRILNGLKRKQHANSWKKGKNIFIGPESDHWLCLSLTHSLTH